GRGGRGVGVVWRRWRRRPGGDAVNAVRGASGHSRYLLRALPSGVRPDPARRLTGDLTSASDWTRALAPTAADPATDAARAALLDLAAVARALDDPSRRADAAARLTQVAERVLSLRDMQAPARDLLAARGALAAGQIEPARAALQRAAGPIVARAQNRRIDSAAIPRDAARLAGAAAAGPGGPHP